MKGITTREEKLLRTQMDHIRWTLTEDARKVVPLTEAEIARREKLLANMEAILQESLNR